MHYKLALKRLKHPLYRISKNSTSLFFHYCKGNVLEDLLGLVDFTVMLNVNDKQRGSLSKLQHFEGNRMSRDIMSAYILHLNEVSSWRSYSVDAWLLYRLLLGIYNKLGPIS